MSFVAEVQEAEVISTNSGRGQVFKCWICVLDAEAVVVEREQFMWLLDHRPIDQEGLQARVDARKAELILRAQNRERIDPGAIT